MYIIAVPTARSLFVFQVIERTNIFLLRRLAKNRMFFDIFILHHNCSIHIYTEML